ADPAAQCDAADSHRARIAEAGHQTVRAGCPRVFDRGQAGLGPGGWTFQIKVQRLHLRQVEDDPAFPGAVAGTAVPAAPPGQWQPSVARKRDHTGDILRISYPGDGCRPAVEATYKDRPRLLVSRAVRCDHLPLERSAKFSELIVVHHLGSLAVDFFQNE